MVTPAYRVLVVEDDPGVAAYVRAILEDRLHCDVRVLGTAAGFAELVRSFRPDVIITDIELPGSSGLELLRIARVIDPAQPMIVMTGHASVHYAVQALRGQADDFLHKPMSASDLVASVSRLAASARRAKARQKVRPVLAIGAHPDDVEIGVGGTLAAHAEAGDPVAILTLSGGARGGDSAARQGESEAAADILGARLFLEDLVDTAIPNRDPTVGIIERVVEEVRPSIVYVHSLNDRHQDHRAVHEATLIATRRVDGIACYQSPSATIDFRPSRFATIDGFTQTKLDLLACFASQSGIRDYMDPEFVLATARYWSRFGTGSSVEPFEIIRDASGIGSAVMSRTIPAEEELNGVRDPHSRPLEETR